MANIVTWHPGGLIPETEETHRAQFNFLCHSISTEDLEDEDTEKEGSDRIHVTQETLEEGAGRFLHFDSTYRNKQEKGDTDCPEGLTRASSLSSQDSGLIAVRQETLEQQLKVMLSEIVLYYSEKVLANQVHYTFCFPDTSQ